MPQSGTSIIEWIVAPTYCIGRDGENYALGGGGETQDFCMSTLSLAIKRYI